MNERGYGSRGVPVEGPADMPPHAELMEQGRRASAVLARCGVGRGSCVAVVLPMGLHSVVLTLACLRLDAVRVTLPPTESAGWFRDRLHACGARVAVTADSCRSEGDVVPVKAVLDQALAGCPAVETVLVVPQLPRPVPWTPGRDRWWDDLLPADTALDQRYPGAMTGHTTSSPDEPARPPGKVSRIVFDDPLTAASDDDRDRGWEAGPTLGDAHGGDITRFLRDKPPHHA